MLDGSGWLPEPLRLIDNESAAMPISGDSAAEALPEFLAGDDDDTSTEEDNEPHPAPAE
jgi:ParB family chromosome partitioning protein